MRICCTSQKFSIWKGETLNKSPMIYLCKRLSLNNLNSDRRLLWRLTKWTRCRNAGEFCLLPQWPRPWLLTSAKCRFWGGFPQFPSSCSSRAWARSGCGWPQTNINYVLTKPPQYKSSPHNQPSLIISHATVHTNKHLSGFLPNSPFKVHTQTSGLGQVQYQFLFPTF